jgi:DNA modification methylase
MKPYSILTGAVMAKLPTLAANSFDAVLCDPPYGLSFMGKSWDHGVPGPEVWAEVLRVLKPGAPLMAFGGTRTFHRLACAIEDGGFVLSDTLCWLHGQGFPKGHAQLKPAWEPITLAWKKGARVLAIDAARIGPTTDYGRSAARSTGFVNKGQFFNGLKSGDGLNEYACPLGRWPANVLLDETSAELLDLQSGTLKSGGDVSEYQRKGASMFTKGITRNTATFERDLGGASRFFYCAKASRSERNAGLEGMLAGPRAENKGRNAAMNSAMRIENGVATGRNANSSLSQNTHPTVKPLKLCEYLAKLILPAERDAPRRLLVPFSGSGSEMLGARNAGWDEVVGIEREPTYAQIARRRLGASRQLLKAA